jgi:putative transposase
MGLIWAIVVHGAGIQDRDGAKLLLERARKEPALLARLERIWADGGYGGTLETWVAEHYECVLEIVRRSDDTKGFVVLPHRWVVERTLGWLNRWRRLSKDYEYLPGVSEHLIYLAMIAVMVRRFAV